MVFHYAVACSLQCRGIESKYTCSATEELCLIHYQLLTTFSGFDDFNPLVVDFGDEGAFIAVLRRVQGLDELDFSVTHFGDECAFLVTDEAGNDRVFRDLLERLLAGFLARKINRESTRPHGMISY